MTAHDEELAPLIRGVFLPEEGEVWAKPDVSQQEFRFIVHYAIKHGLRKAKEAAERYRTDPDTDFPPARFRLDRTRAVVSEEHQLRQGIWCWCAQVRGDDWQAGRRGARDLCPLRPRASIRPAACRALPKRRCQAGLPRALRWGASALGRLGSTGDRLDQGHGAVLARRGGAARSPTPIIPGTGVGSGAPRPTRR